MRPFQQKLIFGFRSIGFKIIVLKKCSNLKYIGNLTVSQIVGAENLIGVKVLIEIFPTCI